MEVAAKRHTNRNSILQYLLGILHIDLGPLDSNPSASSTPFMSHCRAARSVIKHFTAVYLLLQTAFVSNNQDTINTCPCLAERPSSGVTVGVLWGDKKKKGTIEGQRLPPEAPTPVLDLYLFLSGSDPSPKKLLSTHILPQSSYWREKRLLKA